ncbi:MAG: GTP pyrophosphokinase family protein [Lachnospirales bacterium]
MDIIEWDKMYAPYKLAVNELICKVQGYSDSYLSIGETSPIREVVGRVKTPHSMLEKAKRKNIPLDEIWNKIEDIAGVRIICNFIQDIDDVVIALKRWEGENLKIIEERDYIKDRKVSGYRSYHIILLYKVDLPTGPIVIPCEMQIRTLAMDFWATTEHSIQYKYKGKVPTHLKDRLVTSANSAFNLDLELSTIRHMAYEVQEQERKKDLIVQEIINGISLILKHDLKLASEFNSKFVNLNNRDDASSYDMDLGSLIDLHNEVRAATFVYNT